MGTAADPPHSGDGPLRRPPLHHQSRPPQHPRHGAGSSDCGGLGGGGATVSSGDSINSGSVGSCGSGQGSLPPPPPPPPPPMPPMRYGASSLLPPSLGLDLDGMKETILQRLLATPADREEDLLGFARWCLTFVGRTFTAHRTGLAPPPLRAPPTSMPAAASSPATSTATFSCSSSGSLSSFSSSPPARGGGGATGSNGERYHHHHGAAGAVEVGYSDSESAAGSCGGSDAGGADAGKQRQQRRRVRAKTAAGDTSSRVSLEQEPNDDLPRKAAGGLSTASKQQQLQGGKGGGGKEDAVSHQEMDVISILLDFSSHAQTRKHSGGSAASPTPVPTTTATSSSSSSSNIKPPPPPSPTPSLGSLGATPYPHSLSPLNVNVIVPESSPPRPTAGGQVAASAIPPLVAAASSPLSRSPPATPATALTAATADGGSGSSSNSGTYAYYMQAGSPSHGIRLGCYTYFHGVGERGSHKTMFMGQALSWTNEASGGGNGHPPADAPTLVVAGAVHLTRDPALHAALVFDAHKEAFFLLPTPVLLASPVLTRRFIPEPALAELKQRVSGWGVGGPHLEATAAELALSPAAMMAAAEAAGAGSREFGAGGLWACLWGAMMEQGRGGGGVHGQQAPAPGRRTSAYPTSSPSRSPSPSSSFYPPQGPPSPATALALATGAAVSSASAAARYLPYFGAFPASQPQPQPPPPQQHMLPMPPPPPAPVMGGGGAVATGVVTMLSVASSPPLPPYKAPAGASFYPTPSAVGAGVVFSSAPAGSAPVTLVAPDARA